jgi:hypothetical protein
MTHIIQYRCPIDEHHWATELVETVDDQYNQSNRIANKDAETQLKAKLQVHLVQEHSKDELALTLCDARAKRFWNG